jgi:hypothetical protein
MGTTHTIYICPIHFGQPLTCNFEIIPCKLCMTYVKRNLNTASQQTSCVSGWSSTITVHKTHKKASQQYYLKKFTAYFI